MLVIVVHQTTAVETEVTVNT